jgi:hypothetical protein
MRAVMRHEKRMMTAKKHSIVVELRLMKSV